MFLSPRVHLVNLEIRMVITLGRSDDTNTLERPGMAVKCPVTSSKIVMPLRLKSPVLKNSLIFRKQDVREEYGEWSMC